MTLRRGFLSPASLRILTSTLARASQEYAAALRGYGRHLGIAYQVCAWEKWGGRGRIPRGARGPEVGFVGKWAPPGHGVPGVKARIPRGDTEIPGGEGEGTYGRLLDVGLVQEYRWCGVY